MHIPTYALKGKPEDWKTGADGPSEPRRGGGLRDQPGIWLPSSLPQVPAWPSPNPPRTLGEVVGGGGGTELTFCKQSRFGLQPRTGCPGPAWV